MSVQDFTPEQRAEAQERRKFLSALTPEELLQDQQLSFQGTKLRLVVDRLSQMPIGSRLTYLKALKGNSMASAVKSFCMMCVCWQRSEVVQCTDPACPLYVYRPYKTALEE